MQLPDPLNLGASRETRQESCNNARARLCSSFMDLTLEAMLYRLPVTLRTAETRRKVLLQTGIQKTCISADSAVSPPCSLATDTETEASLLQRSAYR